MPQLVQIVRVGGESMSPTLDDGDFVVALGPPLVRRHRPGDVVVVAHARLGLIVKRIAALGPESDWVELAGDAAASCSREALGRVPRRAIVGRAVLRVAPGVRGTSRLSRGPR
jgi:hypothetical protein